MTTPLAHRARDRDVRAPGVDAPHLSAATVEAPVATANPVDPLATPAGPSPGAEHPATSPAARSTVAARAQRLGLSVGLACLGAAFSEVVTDALPDAPLVGTLTPLRLLLALGLAAVLLEWAVGRFEPSIPPRAGRPSWRALASPTLRSRGIGLSTPLVGGSCAALVAAAALTAVLTGMGWSSWRALLTSLGAGLLAWAVARSGGVSGLLALAGVAFSIVTLVALGQAGTAEATGYCRGSIYGDLDTCVPGAMTRATGTFPNPNLLAAALLLLGPLAIAQIRSARDASVRLVGWCVVAGGLFALFMTGSRAAFLALGAALVTYLLLRNAKPWHVAVAAVAATGSVGLAGAYVLVGGDVGIRGTIWRAAAGLVAERPFGTGLATAGAQIQERSPGGPAFQHAHNLWLNWAVEAGLIGGLVALAVTAAVAFAIARAALAGSEVAVWCGAALAGFAAMSLLDHPANAERLSLLLWIVIGLGVASLPHRGRASHGAGRGAP